MIPASVRGRRGALAVLLGLAALLPPGAQAQDCTLKTLAVLPPVDHRLESAAVAVRLDGQPRKLEIDTGGFANMLAPAAAAGYAGWTVANGGYLGFDGIPLDHVVKVPSVEIGPMPRTSLDFFIAPAGYLENDGTLGLTWLETLDLEIDPANATIALFSQDHCDGQGVHWPHADLAVIPMDIDFSGNSTVPLMLDGKPVRATVDTGSADSYLSLDAAERLFGITPDSPGVLDLGRVLSNDGKIRHLYRYQFQSLGLGRLSFADPWLTLVAMSRDFGRPVMSFGRYTARAPGPDLILGMRHLRSLHLYFAYRERKLYVTRAEAPSAGSDPTALTTFDDLLLTADAGVRKHDYDGALAAVDQALRLEPAAPDAYRVRATIHELQGRRQLAVGDFNESIRHNPDDPIVYAERAAFYWRGGDKAKAVLDVNRAIGIDPASSGAYMLRAAFESGMGQPERALEDANRAIRIDPKNASLYSGRATVYATAGHYDLAFADADTAVRLDPKSAAALNNRCWFGAILGRLDQALDDCQASLAIDPDNAEALDSRAFVELQQNRLDRAAADYTAALAADPNLASSLYGRGQVRRRQGDTAGAAADTAAAKAIDPDIAEHFGK